MKNRFNRRLSLAFSGLLLTALALLTLWAFPHPQAPAQASTEEPSSWLLFSLQTAPETWSIARTDSAGKQPDQLLSNGASDFAPRWSPNGRQIAFLRRQNNQTDLFLMDENGNHLQALTSSPEDETGFDWSPSGDQIAYTRLNSVTSEASLRLLTVGQPQDHRLLKKNAQPFFNWSPNGQYLLSFGNQSGLFLLPANGGQGQEWLPNVFVEQARWIDEQTFAAVEVQTGESPSWSLWKFSLSQSQPSLVFQSSGPIVYWFWDSKQFIALVKSWNSLAWYAEDGKMRNVWKNFAEKCPSFPKDAYIGAPSLYPSPDGQRLLAALSCPQGENWLYLLSADGETQQLLYAQPLMSVPDSGGGEYAWSPDGAYVAAILPTGENSSQTWLLSISAALQNPKSAPQVFISENSLRVSPAWQP